MPILSNRNNKHIKTSSSTVTGSSQDYDDPKSKPVPTSGGLTHSGGGDDCGKIESDRTMDASASSMTHHIQDNEVVDGGSQINGDDDGGNKKIGRKSLNVPVEAAEQAIETNGGGGSKLMISTRRGARKYQSPIIASTSSKQGGEGAVDPASSLGDGGGNDEQHVGRLTLAANCTDVTTRDGQGTNMDKEEHLHPTNTNKNTRSKRKRKAKTPIMIEETTLRVRRRGRKRGASAAALEDPEQDSFKVAAKSNDTNSIFSRQSVKNHAAPQAIASSFTTATSVNNSESIDPGSSITMSTNNFMNDSSHSGDRATSAANNANLVTSESVRHLLTIDGPSHRASLQQGRAKQLFSDIVFPMSFPWHRPKVLLAASTPRDIDELHPFLHCHDDMKNLEPRYHDEVEEGGDYYVEKNDCESESGIESKSGIEYPREEEMEREANNLKLEQWLYDSFVCPEVYGSDASGVYKFSTQAFAYRGKCGIDGGMGYVQAHSKNAFDIENPLLLDGKMRCFVRRTNDPGIIQLTAALLPFAPSKKGAAASSSNNSHRLREEECDWRLKTSSLPWSWNLKRRPLFKNRTESEFQNEIENENENIQEELQDDDAIMLERLAHNRQARVQEAYINTRQWKISIKVAGVSSRSTIFPGISRKRATAGDNAPNNAPQVLAAQVLVEQQQPSSSNNNNNNNNNNHQLLFPTSTTSSLVSSQQSSLRPNSRYLCFQGPASDGIITFQRNDLKQQQQQVTTKLLTPASLPAVIQNGRSITMDLAIQNELDGTANILGTYDCRPTNLANSFTDILSQPTEVQNRHFNRRVQVGRTRIIWSTVPRDAFHRPLIYPTGPGVRIPYRSLLSGAKLEAAGYKRPRDVRVSVRVKACDDNHYDDDTANHGVYYHSNASSNDATTNEDGSNNVNVNVAPFCCHDQEEDNHLISNHDNATGRNRNRNKRLRSTILKELRRPHSSTIQCCLSSEDRMLESRDPYRNHFGNAAVMLQRNKFQNFMKRTFELDDTMKLKKKLSDFKNVKRGKKSREIPLRFKARSKLHYIPPMIDCFPLDDGSIRTVCVFAGQMRGINAHTLLRKLSFNLTSKRPLCTICWEEPTEQKSVDSNPNLTRKCISCGIVAHLECCHDPGEFKFHKHKNKNCWKCAVCCHLAQNGSSKVLSLMGVTNGTANNNNSNNNNQQIGIAAHKPRRSQKRPSKFDDDAFECEPKFLPAAREEKKEETKKKMKKSLHVPKVYDFFPKCIFCPHSGGVMSRIPTSSSIGERCPDNKDDDGSNNKSNANDCDWAHDVCRTWCTPLPAAAGDAANCVSKQNVCAICGNNNGKKGNRKESSSLLSSGLIKCAARGCQVHFHPFCALLASKLIDDDDSSSKSNDAHLVTQYTLDMLEVEHPDNDNNNNSAVVGVVPVGYCGLHNPHRDAEYYGLGGVICEAMRIPSASTEQFNAGGFGVPS